MSRPSLRFVVLGLSITSSWGNGHATTYRALLRELAARGHEVLFLERDMPWYAQHRDLLDPPYARVCLYTSFEELRDCYEHEIRTADIVMVGSYVPEGVRVGWWVNSVARCAAFYDIDTPVTMAKLARSDYEYLSPPLIPRYDLYLSFTGGPLLRRIEDEYGSPMARVLYCSVDPGLYYPEECEPRWDLGYLGTYSLDRQERLEATLLHSAREWREGRFIVAGPLYPPTIGWSANVHRIEHLPPAEHRRFYSSQRFTLNVTRADMRRAGYSPSVRLFEAAACATPILSDSWAGLESIFAIGSEILVVNSPRDTLTVLQGFPEEERAALGRRARDRVLAAHTAAHRARELETHALFAIVRNRRSPALFSPVPAMADRGGPKAPWGRDAVGTAAESRTGSK
ncbi:MAG: glycosyltransferase [Bryobacteraceae bacterium]